uniref:DNA recombination and repair protein Rad51-like C-terminal domain-containing protein n=2 Tax=Panagrolaimus sp. PS1159 TaxID=55785 RepID=A0AC35FTS8_9BILA
MKKRCNETGFQWFQRIDPKRVNRSTGIKQLDNFMKFGFGPGYVLEINGAGGSGKTEFCFTMMAETFSKHDNNNYIYYFDYTGAFNPLRFKEILMNRFGPKTEEQVNELLKRVISIIIRDEQIFLEALQRFKEVTKNRKVSLLIIENIGLILGGTVRSLPYFRARGRFIQERVYQAIQRISKEYFVPVVVTNHLRGWKISMNPALGKLWASLIYHHILIIRQKREFLMQNFDVKHGPTSAAIKFYITEKGITES